MFPRPELHIPHPYLPLQRAWHLNDPCKMGKENYSRRREKHEHGIKTSHTQEQVTIKTKSKLCINRLKWIPRSRKTWKKGRRKSQTMIKRLHCMHPPAYSLHTTPSPTPDFILLNKRKLVLHCRYNHEGSIVCRVRHRKGPIQDVRGIDPSEEGQKLNQKKTGLGVTRILHQRRFRL